MQTRSRRRTTRVRPWLCATTCVAIAGPVLAAAPGDDDAKAGTPAGAKVNLKLLASGATQKLGGYTPQQLKLSDQKPAALKKAPELAGALYGEIRFGGKTYLLAVDEPAQGDARLYVDADGDADLTNDPDATWAKQTSPGPDGRELNQYVGSFRLPLDAGEKAEPVTISAYRFDKNDPRRAQLKNTLLYYGDYLFEGEVTLGDATYPALLTDDGADGVFGGADGKGSSLLIDLNGDGAFSQRGEVFESGKPFNVKGTTWVITAGAGAAPVAVVKSDEQVAEILPPPNHSVGRKITAFTAKRTDGRAVNFPADYKGKVVMLDFWATWCPPCMAEVPGLVRTYKEFHPQGVEILGVSLDQPNWAPAVKAVTTEQGMTWPQVYDGKFWKAAVAVKYGIESIPAAFLVDGDTGEILAAGSSLRGDNLGETLRRAVEKKKGPAAEPSINQPAKPKPEPATAVPAPADKAPH